MQDNLLRVRAHFLFFLWLAVPQRTSIFSERPGKHELFESCGGEIEVAETLLGELVYIQLGISRTLGWRISSAANGVDLVDEIGAIEQLDEEIAVSEVIEDEESWGGVELLV